MADPTIVRELTSLRAEMTAAQGAHPQPAGVTVGPVPQGAASQETASAAPNPAGQSEADADEKQVRDLMQEFVDEASHFFDEAEKNISAHPMASVVGALVVGILVGTYSSIYVASAIALDCGLTADHLLPSAAKHPVDDLP